MGIILPTKTSDADAYRVIVAAPDGYVEATLGGTTAAVTSNVAVLEVSSLPPKLTISGPGMPAVTFDLADHVGAGPIQQEASPAGDTNARSTLTDLALRADVRPGARQHSRFRGRAHGAARPGHHEAEVADGQLRRRAGVPRSVPDGRPAVRPDRRVCLLKLSLADASRFSCSWRGCAASAAVMRM